MAARKHKIKLTDSWKEKIKVSMLLNRLQDHVLGDTQMSNTQIKAADILLRKFVPDMKAVELTGEDGKAIKFELVAPWMKEVAQKRGWA